MMNVLLLQADALSIITRRTRMKKKILTGVILFVLVLSLVACGKDKKDDKSKKEAKKTTDATTEATTEATTAAATTEAAAADTTEAAAEEKAADDSNSGSSDDSDFYVVATNFDKQTVESYAAEVKKAYTESNYTALSQMILYPITMYPDVTCNNAEDFMNYCEGKSIASADLESMEAETCKDMFANSGGICLGDGQVWIGEDVNTGRLGIINISGMAER
jgi:hypothetical protein